MRELMLTVITIAFCISLGVKETKEAEKNKGKNTLKDRVPSNRKPKREYGAKTKERVKRYVYKKIYEEENNKSSRGTKDS